MRVLLDESVPRQLAQVLAGHEVQTVTQAGWSGTKNGELLRLADATFDVFVTGDQHLQYQQNLSKVRIRIVVIKARDNRVKTILALAERILAAIDDSKVGQLVMIEEQRDI